MSCVFSESLSKIIKLTMTDLPTSLAIWRIQFRIESAIGCVTFDQIFIEGYFMSDTTKSTKSIPMAIMSMIAGIAAVPVAGLVSTALGIGLATLSVYLIFVAG